MDDRSLEISVGAFFEHVRVPLDMELCEGGSGLRRHLGAPRIQKPGLALTGYGAFVHPDRVRILGQTELSYLQTLQPERRDEAIRYLVGLELACIVVTKGLALPPTLLAACKESQTPLFRTSMTSSEFIRRVLAYLADLLAPRCSVHGVLMEVSGVGVLISGPSGIGKSECALNLILRGHRLVADDVVEIRRRGEDLVGQAASLIKDLLEIRGLGVLNVSELYGVAATRDHKRIELRVELEDWNQGAQYDRTGLDLHVHDILGVKVRSLTIPVRPGRSIAGIIEVAARNYLLHLRGYYAAQELNRRISDSVDLEAQVAEERASGGSSDLDLGVAARLSPIADHIEDEVE